MQRKIYILDVFGESWMFTYIFKNISGFEEIDLELLKMQLREELSPF